MSQNFVPGHFAPVVFANAAAAGGVGVQLDIKDHTVDLTVLLHDVTNTGTGGVRARIAGPLDAQGTVNADLDLDSPPYGAAAIFPGVRGLCLFGFSLSRALQIPVRVEKLHFAAAVDKEVMYSFDVKMDANAGVVVYPAL